MELTLHTEGWFDAAHHLDNYEGACKNLHGHTYKVIVEVKGDDSQLDKASILWDFSELKKIIKQLDHSEKGELNNIIFLGKDIRINPTAEVISRWIYWQLKENKNKLKFKVRVYEQIQPKESWAEYGDW